MAFPTYTYANSHSPAGGTTHTITVPSGTAVGELMIGMVAAQSTQTFTVTWPGTWTVLYVAPNTYFVFSVAYKFVGAVDSTFDVLTSLSAYVAARVFNVKNAHLSTSPAIGVESVSVGANPNPVTLDPADWAVEDTLWLAAAAIANAGVTVSATPANYTGLAAHTSVGGSNTGVGLVTAHRNLRVASENPGAFTTSPSTAYRANVLAIRPRIPTSATVEIGGVGSANASVVGTLRRALPQVGTGLAEVNVASAVRTARAVAASASAHGEASTTTAGRVRSVAAIAPATTSAIADVVHVPGAHFFRVEAYVTGRLRTESSLAETLIVDASVDAYLGANPLKETLTVESGVTSATLGRLRLIRGVGDVNVTIDPTHARYVSVTPYVLRGRTAAGERPLRVVETTALAVSGARHRLFRNVRTLRTVAEIETRVAATLIVATPRHPASARVDVEGNLIATRYLEQVVTLTLVIHTTESYAANRMTSVVQVIDEQTPFDDEELGSSSASISTSREDTHVHVFDRTFGVWR